MAGTAAFLALCIVLGASQAAAQGVVLEMELPRTLLLLRQDDGVDVVLASLREKLSEAGFLLVDPAFAATAASRQQVQAAHAGDEAAAVAVGRDFGAQLLVLGSVEVGTAPDPVDPALSLATAEVQLRAVRMDNGATVATAAGRSRALDATRKAAGSRAARSAVDSILAAQPFLGRIANDWSRTAWREADYFPADPGALAAAAASENPASVHLAVSSARPLPDTSSASTRGIVLSRSRPVPLAVEGVVVGPASSVLVEGVQAELSPAPPEIRTRVPAGLEARLYRATLDLPLERDTMTVEARGGGGTAQVVASPWVRKRWAVIIGVGDYDSPDVPDLAYAAADARAVYELLQTPAGGGFVPENMLLLLDGEASAEAMRQALFVFLRQAQWNDLVLVYFAGHGAPDPARPDNLYLLSSDADLASLPTTAFPMWDVKTALRRHIAAEQVIVIADACHAGGTREGQSNPVGEGFADLFSPSRRVTLTAAGTDEVSFEGEQWGGHGVFTYHLLGAFSGGAGDRNGDGVISFREVAEYVSGRVRADTRGRQNPDASGLGDIPWSQAPTPPLASSSPSP